MILVDANLLLYATNERVPFHAAARRWWEQTVASGETVGLCWATLLAFVRISTHPRLHDRPLSLREAVELVELWLGRDNIRLLEPTSSHWDILRDMLEQSQASGNLVTDAHLAAIAIEHGATLYSTDADFSRFRRLRWRNPITGRNGKS